MWGAFVNYYIFSAECYIFCARGKGGNTLY